MTLFDASPENASLSYRHLRDPANEYSQAARAHCEELWQTFAPLADRHFLAEFPARTHERWFEMYLAVSLMRAGYQVQAPKPGPDVLLTVDGRRIWIEATCATAGEAGRPDSVPQPRYFTMDEQPEFQPRPTDEMTLRIRNSLEGKQLKFQEYVRQGIVRADDLAVIAINVHGIPHAWADMNDLMRRALYGLGHPMIGIDPETHQQVDFRYQPQPVLAKKSTGEHVVVEPFVDGSMSHIAAVIGSREDAGNPLPQPGMGFSLYPNLSAAVPWLRGALRLGEEWIATPAHGGGHDLNLVSYRL